MSLLSQHIIQGAAHDSSARTPPPRCHPDTRVKLIARITAWFEGQSLQELLLWITGPAGVGKSAIVQTFAEYLAKSKSLGVSVFISRPNKRNNPNGIFITIAYQLATRIEAYRNYIVERISLDPELLRGDMEAQFVTFIVEPFVERKIGAGGRRWCILLDGLDELRGEDAQCNIIHLISTFVHEHRDTPLVWIIASRPESHLSNTFEDDEVNRSCWTEYIPIDSTEACEDVERYLRSSLKGIQKKYRQSLPSD
jgi:Cdc6-like AAA superfamily ATPase